MQGIGAVSRETTQMNEGPGHSLWGADCLKKEGVSSCGFEGGPPLPGVAALPAQHAHTSSADTQLHTTLIMTTCTS
jgi:hypothetical protein